MRNILQISILTCIAFTSLNGCSGMGPNSLKQDRSNYNIAVQKTNDEQLLLNLVRLKYRDTPFFLEVSNVATQFTFSSSADANATFPEGPAFNVFGLGAGVARTERPTVSYSPLQGEKFIQRFLSPVSLKTISLLFHSGWNIDRVFRVCFQHINKIKNAPSASGPTPEIAPKYEDFIKFSNLFRFLQSKDELEMDYGLHENFPALVIHFSQKALEFSQTQELLKTLNLSPDSKQLIFSPKFDENVKGLIKVETRSLLGAMFYLSQSVEVPLKDRESGKVTHTKTETGETFEWQKITGNLMRIQSIDSHPDQNVVAIKYRGSWFYIDDSDLTSKSTFSMLGQIFSLQAGKSKSMAPVLTLPVGQ
ncbi:MAG: hypothetical protein ACQ9MH_02605 [Nitrospinales bacterium]